MLTPRLSNQRNRQIRLPFPPAPLLQLNLQRRDLLPAQFLIQPQSGRAGIDPHFHAELVRLLETPAQQARADALALV